MPEEVLRGDDMQVRDSQVQERPQEIRPDNESKILREREILMDREFRKRYIHSVSRKEIAWLRFKNFFNKNS